MKSMRILHLHRNLPPDSFTGVAVQVHRLANALTDLGHEVAVMTHSLRPEDAKYSVLELPRLPGGLRPFQRLAHPLSYRGLDFSGFDIIHVHGDGAFLRTDPRFIRTFYGTAGEEARHARRCKGKAAQLLSYAMEKRECRIYPHCAAISSHVKEHLPGISHVIPCMLASPPRESLPGKHPDPTLLFLGSRNTRKRGEWALRIFSRLRREIPRLRMHYVGPEADVTAMRTEFAGNRQWEGLHCHCRLSQEALGCLYAESWMYLSLSSYEGFGVSIIEAMAAGCLPISISHPGAREIISDGENGFLADEKVIESLASKLLRDKTLTTALAEKSLLHARNFSPDRIARRYESLYHMADASQVGKGSA